MKYVFVQSWWHNALCQCNHGARAAGSSDGTVLGLLAGVQSQVQAVRQREARIAEDPSAGPVGTAATDSASLELVHEADSLLEEVRLLFHSCHCFWRRCT